MQSYKLIVKRQILELRYKTTFSFFDNRGKLLKEISERFQELVFWESNEDLIVFFDRDDSLKNIRLSLEHNRATLSFENDNVSEDFLELSMRLLEFLVETFELELTNIGRLGVRIQKVYEDLKFNSSAELLDYVSPLFIPSLFSNNFDLKGYQSTFLHNKGTAQFSLIDSTNIGGAQAPLNHYLMSNFNKGVLLDLDLASSDIKFNSGDLIQNFLELYSQSGESNKSIIEGIYSQDE